MSAMGSTRAIHQGEVGAAANMPIVRLVEVRKRYPGCFEDVLSGVELEARPGELIGVCGESGAGKSTLLNLLGCLDVPSSGRYEYRGRDVGLLSEMDRNNLRAQAIGFVFQQCHLLRYLTVAENLEVPWLYGLGRAPNDLADRIVLALDRVGLAGFAARLPGQLSGGEMQRVALARALVRLPELVLADEPTGNLDESNSELVFGLLRTVAHDGGAVVFVTHNRGLWGRCDRRLRLVGGRLIECD